MSLIYNHNIIAEEYIQYPGLNSEMPFISNVGTDVKFIKGIN